MEGRDFRVIKSGEQFLRNYKLHDKSESIGCKILNNYGYATIPFGEDRRYEKVWEAGKDKPDCFIIKKEDPDKRKLCMLDWKAKRSDSYKINERAYKSYIEIIGKINLKCIIAVAVFKKEAVSSFKYFLLPDEDLIQKRKREWDGNYTVIFDPERARDFRKIDVILNNL